MRLSIFILALFIAANTFSQIRVSNNNRTLETVTGEPFFWLGDTDWELVHRLTREEILEVLNVRKQQGFNVLQVVALAEMDGIRQPNRYGDWPLNNEDPEQLLVTPGKDSTNAYEYDYWDHLDFFIDQASALGIYVGLLPTWGDKVAHMWGDGPIIFNPANAEEYAKILAKRYAGKKNVIWILGGDRPANYKYTFGGKENAYDDKHVWRAMAKGIEDVLGKDAFIAYHPAGGSYSTSQFFHSEPWLDMNAFQSGHGARETEAWNWVLRDLALKPEKPTIDMEPCYEDHPVNPWDGKWTKTERGYFDAYDVRARIYRGVLAGACGVTYGHHQVWQFFNPDLYKPINIGDTVIGWKKALRAEGAVQMGYLKKLMLSRPMTNRIADQSLVLSEKGKDYRDLVFACRNTEGKCALIYLPQRKAITVDLTKLSGSRKRVWWFMPKTGKVVDAGSFNTSRLKLMPPGDERDYVLVIDDEAAAFGIPGAINEGK